VSISGDGGRRKPQRPRLFRPQSRPGIHLMPTSQCFAPSTVCKQAFDHGDHGERTEYFGEGRTAVRGDSTSFRCPHRHRAVPSGRHSMFVLRGGERGVQNQMSVFHDARSRSARRSNNLLIHRLLTLLSRAMGTAEVCPCHSEFYDGMNTQLAWVASAV
jgi:hypothetical protein